MRRALTRATVLALTVTLTLTGCGGQERATFTEPAPQVQPVGDAGADTDASTAEAGTADAAAQTAAGDTDIPALVPIAWPEAPRELTKIEQQFMIQPGPYAGDAYDETAVLEAVLAMNPQTAQEWQQAIQSQIQGDYAEDLKSAITFDPSIGEGLAEPTEGDGAVDAEAAENESVGSNHFALVLDASGSMAEASGSGTRMEEAREAITGFVGTLPEGSTVSLRVYGHEGDNSNAGKQESCASTETVYQGPPDTAELAAQLEAVEPTGWTPLASAISAAEQDIPADATDGIVYVVTDGLETCGGDPVAAAGQLADTGIQPIVNVIGFQAGDADQEALRAIAEAGGGAYTQADTKADLEAYWDAEYDRMMAAWTEWRRDELDRIDTSGQENMTEADEVGTRLMTAAETEGERGMDLADTLRDNEHVDYDTGRQVWSYFYDRKREMWGYAYNVRIDNWSAAYLLSRDAWSEAYGKGTAKWSEYYSKKTGN